MSQILVMHEVQLESANRPRHLQLLLLIQWDLGGLQTGDELVLQMMDIQGDMNYYIDWNLFLYQKQVVL